MQARTMRCHALDPSVDVLRADEVEVPDPAAGEVRVRLKACALNFPDVLMIQGGYQFKPPLPFAPGMEAAGDVESVGAGVTGLKAGDAVVVNMRHGGLAEAVTVPADAVRPMPPGLDYDRAAGFSAAYLTAWVALVRRGALQAGETLLVHGAAGGVGLAAVDLGRHLGARVIATAGTDEKLAVVKALGADEVLNYTLADGGLGGFREAVKALTDGRGADVIYDPVGGDVFDESLRCIAWNGRLLVIGFTSGRIGQVPSNIPLIKGFSVVGVRAGEYGRRDPQAGRENRDAIFELAASGAIHPHVCAHFPLERAAEALRMLVERRAVGKVVVTLGGWRPERVS
ncbi:MAG TPA: NADPH:quinone oxidoreductase family protein [Pseudomonadales bacterium]|nr:NADPH:quinone oxidoreductase family protein [Pseudomonadales bacterium]